MSEISGVADDARADLKAARLKKINLEIEGLKKGKGEGKLARYLPLLTTLLAVAGFVFGVYQFRAQQAERLRADSVAREREFKKALWDRQLGYYLEAAQAASTLASFNENDEKEIQPERTKARLRFWQLYYGELAVIEDPNVSRAMVEYGRCLREYDLHLCDQSDLKKRARALAQEFRNAVSRSWDEPLGQVGRSVEQQRPE